MKKLLYTFLAVSMIFSACKKEEDDIPQTMEDVVVGKRWIANNANDGFYLSEEGGLYTIYKCEENVLLGDWIIEEDKIKYRYYENSLEITTLFCVVSEYTATQIKVVDSSNPTTTINIIYNVYTEVNSCITYVPDDYFEAYLEANGMGDGISGNDFVLTANINTVTFLNVGQENIADLTGIEAFTALTTLNCWNNQLTSIDVSTNIALTDLDCYGNQLTSLDLRNGNNTSFTEINAQNNPSLYCIGVDDDAWSTANWAGGWPFLFDSQHYFSNNCGSK
jgi:hypothetical protein